MLFTILRDGEISMWDLVYNQQKRICSIVMIFILGFSLNTHAQQGKSQNVAEDSIAVANQRVVLIDNIFVTGNKKTKSRIITRELSFKIGDQISYATLQNMIKADRDKVYNTKLFNTVEVGILELDIDKVDIVIKVTERWYLFPIPLIDIIDRNFNDWWVNHDHDFNRIIYGLSLYHFNMRGMNERMTLTAQFGYSRRYEFEYDVPYIDKSQQNGLGVFIKYIEYNNLHYDNFQNKRVFHDSEDILKTNVFTGINYVRRNSFYTRHYVDLRYSDSNIADTILVLNPNYLGIDGNKQQFFSLAYTFSHDKRDIVAYPLVGYRIAATIEKVGLGIFDDIDITRFRASYSRFLKWQKGFYFSNYSAVYLSTPGIQPYSETKGLGFGNDAIRGYELYVIHGQHYFVNKTSLKKVLLAGSTEMDNFPLEQFKHFPYAFYLKTYFDVGYASNTQNYEGNQFLADQLLLGGGVGLDIVTMYDVVVRLEYSWNSIGDNGFFFHIQSEF